MTPRTRAAALAEHVEHFRARFLQDALSEATSIYWRRRARAFRDAAPRAGDFTGHANHDDLIDAWKRCHEIATACEHASEVALLQVNTTHDETRETPS